MLLTDSVSIVSTPCLAAQLPFRYCTHLSPCQIFLILMLQVEIEQTMLQETPDANPAEPPGTCRLLTYSSTAFAAPVHALPGAPLVCHCQSKVSIPGMQC